MMEELDLSPSDVASALGVCGRTLGYKYASEEISVLWEHAARGIYLCERYYFLRDQLKLKVPDVSLLSGSIERIMQSVAGFDMTVKDVGLTLNVDIRAVKNNIVIKKNSLLWRMALLGLLWGAWK